MGNIGSRIGRRQKSKAELLEILETGIRKKERDRKINQSKQGRVKRWLIITSITVYIILIILNLCFMVHDLVLLVYPGLAILTIVLISRFYTAALKKSHYKLYTMREEKQKLLEDVKSTETYMVAKEILEKYGSSENLLQESTSSNSRKSNTIDF